MDVGAGEASSGDLAGVGEVATVGSASSHAARTCHGDMTKAPHPRFRW
ncbi:hypothetical protein [Cellulomonas xiejunii]|nr:hypothetical protein [Cellulomonas xiejunii]